MFQMIRRRTDLFFEISSESETNVAVADNDDDALDSGVKGLRKRGDFVAPACVVSGTDRDDVNAVVVIGCDTLSRLCKPSLCCCCCRLRCRADEAEDPPTSAVLPKEETSPIAANRKISVVAAIGTCIGRPTERSFIAMMGSREKRDDCNCCSMDGDQNGQAKWDFDNAWNKK